MSSSEDEASFQEKKARFLQALEPVPLAPAVPSAETTWTATKSPVIFGLYGIPGSGKSHLRKELKHLLAEEGESDNFLFFEGSEVIGSLTSGGLNAFKQLDEDEKTALREQAIDKIKDKCTSTGKAGVVVGHCTFLKNSPTARLNEKIDCEMAVTDKDLETYTHIIYLDTPAQTVWDRTKRDIEDKSRARDLHPVERLREWQTKEKELLRGDCAEHQIVFFTHHNSSCDLLRLLQFFRVHTEEHNLAQAKARLQLIVDHHAERTDAMPGTMLVFDGDKTLAAQDSGTMFFEKVKGKLSETPLQDIFKSPLKHSYAAFCQAMMLYEQSVTAEEFETICEEVASGITMYPEFVNLLNLVAPHRTIGAVVLTSGMRLIWEKVLKKQGFGSTFHVIGGGRIEEGMIVDRTLKGALVQYMQPGSGFQVFAFGDSPVDIEMLSKAFRAIIVVGEEKNRSKSMAETLALAIDNKQLLNARQAILPWNLDKKTALTNKALPVVDLTSPAFIASIFGGWPPHINFQFVHLTYTTAAKLLATPMRDAAVAGPALQEAHRQAGRYLAQSQVVDIVGLEEVKIKHVQGEDVKGFQLLNESRNTVVALMRGGEPMAKGVSDAFPKAMFVHAKEPHELRNGDHLQGQVTVILVDSVVNTGKTILEFVEHVRKMHASIRIVVVTGVVQAKCVEDGSKLWFKEKMAKFMNVYFVALRISQTEFKGSKETDTGNRLFNTTHLD